MRISDWSSDVCSSDLRESLRIGNEHVAASATSEANHRPECARGRTLDHAVRRNPGFDAGIAQVFRSRLNAPPLAKRHRDRRIEGHDAITPPLVQIIFALDGELTPGQRSAEALSITPGNGVAGLKAR